MKRGIAVLLALCLLLTAAAAAAEEPVEEPVEEPAEESVAEPVEIRETDWTKEERARLKVGNPTAMKGRFFTSLWGGTTADLDVQDLLHACSPVRYDIGGSQFVFDRSVLQDAAILNGADGSRTYLLVFYDDLRWSDGTRITAADYAFSFLLGMDPAVAETGGTPPDCSWIDGAEEYLNGTAETLRGLRVLSDGILQVTVKADALPYFYELSRLMIHPYPASVIAPGIRVLDEGQGACLSAPLTAELLRQTVLDEKAGYLSHPSVVSGPYTLVSFDGKKAVLTINPYFKGTWQGMIPRIGKVEYTVANNADMVAKLKGGEFDLLDKVTLEAAIGDGIRILTAEPEKWAMESEARVGLTLVWFMEDSARVQDNAVRQAIACCFDRDAFVKDYTGKFGVRVDGFYGLGQWPYRLAAGLMNSAGTEETPATATDAAPVSGTYSLDGLTKYELNTRVAARLLDKTGWNLNENGDPFDPERDVIRYRETAQGLTGLNLTMAAPESGTALAALETHLAAHLKEAGINLTIVPIPMDKLEEAYHTQAKSGYDMVYLGEDFSIAFDPKLLAPVTETESELHSVKEELYALARDMVRTEPNDLDSFMEKWVKLQERLTQTLPLIPVYSNTYFDFFTRGLHDYRITEAVTWGEAVVKSYMSDIEILSEEALAAREQELDELEAQFGE